MAQHSFGQWLKWRREALDLSQKMLAGSIGCSEIMIRKLEADARRPSLKIAQLLAEALDVAPEKYSQFIGFARSVQPNHSFLNYWTSANRAMSNLISQPNPLIGRERLVLSLCDKLRHEDLRLLTLTGPPGVGKTRLSIEIAWQLLDLFEDGVYFIALDKIAHAELLPSAILGAMGIPLNDNLPSFEAAQRYLKDRHLLLLMDNFEHVLEASANLSEMLVACPFLRLLVSSRAPLQLRYERQIRVPPLSEEASVTLFIERAQAVNADFELSADNADAIHEICNRLDGIPLAIELMAAYARLLSPEELLPRLSGNLMLKAEGKVDAAGHHQSLETAMNSSFALLSPELQRLFVQLSVFAAGWTAEAAQAVCLDAAMLNNLMALLDRSLIQSEKTSFGTSRYKMLVPVREYALQKLDAEAWKASLEERHCAYFCQFAEQAASHLEGSGQILWLEYLDTDYGNLSAALNWSSVSEQGFALRLRLLRALQWYWVLRGRIEEGYRYTQAALRELPPGISSADRAKILSLLASLATFYGDIPNAVPAAEEAYSIFSELEDTAGILHALSSLGFLAWVRSELDRAESLLMQGLDLSYQEKSLFWQSAFHFFLANFYLVSPAKQAMDRVQSNSEKGLQAARSLKNHHHAILNLSILANIHLMNNNLILSKGHFEDALTLAQELRDQRSTATALSGLGRLALREAEIERAESFYTKSLQICHELQQKGGVIECLFRLAEVFKARQLLLQAALLLALVEVNLDAPLVIPIEREYFQQLVAEVRDSLAEPDFNQCQAAGQALGWEKIDSRWLSELIRKQFQIV